MSSSLASKKLESKSKSVIRSIPAYSALTLLLSFAMGCAKSPKTIVYDEAWSSAAGIAAVQCAQGYQKSCRNDSTQDERRFAEKLVADFSSEPDCKGLDLIVDNGADNDRGTSNLIAQAIRLGYWRLRVDYRPHLMHQEAQVSLGRGRSVFGVEADDDTVDHSAAFIIQSTCKDSKQGGVGMYW